MAVTPKHGIPLINGESVANFQDINDALVKIDTVLTLPSQAGLVKQLARFDAVLATGDWTADGDRWKCDISNAAITTSTDVDVVVDVSQAGSVPLYDYGQPMSGKVRIYAYQQPTVSITVTVIVRGVLA